MNLNELTKAIPGIFIDVIFVKFWFVWAILAIFFLIKFAFRFIDKQELAKAGLSVIDKMDGRRFEEYLVTLFEGLGYKVELTKFKGDYGGDLVLSMNGVKTVVQAKRHKGKVGVKAVQEVVSAKGYYNCDEAMVVTNSKYTDQARELAGKNGVLLWNRHDLAGNLNKVKEEPVKAKTLEGEAVEAIPKMSFDEFVSDKCVVCGKAVSEKVKKYCLDNAQRFNEKVYCFNCQKSVQ